MLQEMTNGNTEEKNLDCESLILQTKNEQKSIIYVLVSIMSAQYQNLEQLKKMMREIHARYEDSGIPIVYVCGDTVYNITKSFLFKKDAARDPVIKGRNSWLKTHNAAVNDLRAEGSKLHHEVVFWDTLKESSPYLNIRKFTDVVFNRSLTLEKLQAIFPNADAGTLNLFLKDRQSTKLLENVPVVSEEFNSKNLNKLQNTAKAKIKIAASLIDSLEATGYSFEKPKNQEKILGLDKLKDGLLQATHEYLSEEFAVFLLLSFLQDASEIKLELNLNSNALNASFNLEPRLSYPISQGSDIIFRTFRMVEALYLQYYLLLQLPNITRPVAIFDPFNPEIPYPLYSIPSTNSVAHRNPSILSKHRASHSTASFINGLEREHIIHEEDVKSALHLSVNNSIDSDNNSQDSDASIIAQKLETIESHNSTKDSQGLEESSGIYSAKNTSTIFKSTQAFALDNVSVITSKIIKKISVHLKLKGEGELKTKTIYKYGVTCDITSSSRLNIGEKIRSLQDQDITSFIQSIVMSVEEQDEESVIFNYQNLCFELVVKPTGPHPFLEKTVTLAPTLKK